MVKQYRITGLDCANCAENAARAIGKINGVRSASVAFITEKLLIDADEPMHESILEQARKTVKKIEPECRIEER